MQEVKLEFILAEAEEKALPTEDELNRRAGALLANGKQVDNTVIFTEEERRILLKGRDAALEKLDLGRHETDDWEAFRDAVWSRCFRRSDFCRLCIIYKQTDQNY